MTTGIYELTFAPGVKYIGKAIDIESRWDEHASSFLRNKAAAKMMAAFKQYGYPDGQIIAKCHKDHIDFMECYYIDRERPLLNTQVCDSISDEDFAIVQEMISLLGYSTIEHLTMIKDFNAKIDQLEDDLAESEAHVDRLQQEFDEKHATLTAVIEMKDKERRFRIAMQEKEREIKELEEQLQLKQQPWYKRLLG